MSDADPRRQVKQRLDALKAAGVEFVPARATIPAAESHSTSAPTPSGSPVVVPPESSLFDQPTDVPAAPEDRRRALELMADEVSRCDRCPELFATRTQTVFGVGRLSPDVCFVGEAPGADEDRLGEPFVGAAGQLLTKIIGAMGLTRDDVYICNTIKCRPPNNRTPAPAECGNCSGYFERQLELVQPKTVVCLGAVAAQNVLGTKTGITRLRGTFHQYKSIPVMCTFHPSYLLRLQGDEQQKAKAACWDDMKQVLRKVGRPVPGGK